MKKPHLYRKFRGLSDRELQVVLVSLHQSLNQHAGVINAQRDKIKQQELRIGLLEEKVYATLSPEERERLGEIIDPQPAVEGERLLVPDNPNAQENPAA